MAQSNLSVSKNILFRSLTSLSILRKNFLSLGKVVIFLANFSSFSLGYVVSIGRTFLFPHPDQRIEQRILLQVRKHRPIVLPWPNPTYQSRKTFCFAHLPAFQFYARTFYL